LDIPTYLSLNKLLDSPRGAGMVCQGLLKKGDTRLQGEYVGGQMGLLTLQDIFCTSYPEYERTHALPAHVRRAARAIMQCRTAALGGHVQACPDGHMSRIWYNSCRHRSCPQCAYLQTERWLARAPGCWPVTILT
jgi:hypothetical protein